MYVQNKSKVPLSITVWFIFFIRIAKAGAAIDLRHQCSLFSTFSFRCFVVWEFPSSCYTPGINQLACSIYIRLGSSFYFTGSVENVQICTVFRDVISRGDFKLHLKLYRTLKCPVASYSRLFSFFPPSYIVCSWVCFIIFKWEKLIYIRNNHKLTPLADSVSGNS